MAFQKIEPAMWNDNLFTRVGKEWMLITAGDREACNTMTASWGGFGVLWEKPVATCYIRPSRFTYRFTEQSDYYSLCFFPEQYRKALTLCGTKSGRDMNKFEAAGLTPIFDFEVPALAEADTVVICRKRYADDIEPQYFTDGSAETEYPKGDYHRFYIGEIVGIYRKA